MTGIIQAILSFFGVQSSSAANYIEDVFSTYLYTGNGSTQTITNGIDLSGKGGLVWMKSRSAATDHALYDTARGATFDIGSNLATGQTTQATGLTAFNSNGFNIGALAKLNTNAATYTSWTFRDQAKFFDVVTYTGNGSNRTISHNLGSVPGCIFVKRTDTTGDWQVYHRSLTNTQYMVLNSTGNVNTGATRWNSTTATDTVFSVGTDATVNANGGTYVAYLFAHDSGGFGASGTDNVITCGTYLGSNHRLKQVVTLGYEPQCVFIKNITTTNQWVLVDNMRGMADAGSQAWLAPNTAAVETTTASDQVVAASTGFFFNGTIASLNETGSTFIYIAIRRGPMKTPTSSTTVFSPVARTGTGANATVTGGSGVTDLAIIKNRGAGEIPLWTSRLTANNYLASSSTAAQVAAGTTILQANPWDVMDGVKVGTTSAITNASGNTYINYLFDRAPGFFDVVCYTGTGAARTINHNLTVVPQLMIFKNRVDAQNWAVYSQTLGATKKIFLNTASGEITATIDIFNNTAPTASVFSVGNDGETNANGQGFVAYLFATVGGVSKVGSYTGTGTTQQINCGFTSGSRFVMIKRTDSTGDWYVWDSARGIVAGNDPYFFMNSISNESTGGDLVDTYSLGFEISSTAPAAVNANGGTFIFLAIA
jgi:hypothetical protein